jgi:hypothetical protein
MDENLNTQELEKKFITLLITAKATAPTNKEEAVAKLMEIFEVGKQLIDSDSKLIPKELLSIMTIPKEALSEMFDMNSLLNMMPNIPHGFSEKDKARGDELYDKLTDEQKEYAIKVMENHTNKVHTLSGALMSAHPTAFQEIHVGKPHSKEAIDAFVRSIPTLLVGFSYTTSFVTIASPRLDKPVMEVVQEDNSGKTEEDLLSTRVVVLPSMTLDISCSKDPGFIPTRVALRPCDAPAAALFLVQYLIDMDIDVTTLLDCMKSGKNTVQVLKEYGKLAMIRSEDKSCIPKIINNINERHAVHLSESKESVVKKSKSEKDFIAEVLKNASKTPFDKN